MIKIEKIFENGKAQVGSDEVFEGQLLTHDDYARIKVTSGAILVSIDEKDLVTLNAEELLTEVAPKQENKVKDEVPAPQPSTETIQELPTSSETVDSKNLSTNSANSTSPKDTVPHSAKSTNTTKK